LFEFALTAEAKLRPRQCLQPLILNFVTAPHAYSEGAICNSLESRFNQAQNRSSLAAPLEQRLLRHTDDAPVRAVLCCVDVQRLCFLIQTAQELPGLMTLKFKLSFELVNLDFFHRRFPYWPCCSEYFLKTLSFIN
jgi:hypothetical protein